MSHFSHSDSVSVPVFDTMTHLIARISNRVIVGKELCRNEGFIHAAATFAESLLTAPFIQWSPLFLRPCVLFLMICCSTFNSTKDLYISSYPPSLEAKGGRLSIFSPI